MDSNHICINCMSEKGTAEVCPVCGFREDTMEISPMFIPPRSILNGRYLIGRVLGYGGFGITYLALDLNLQIKLAIKEYLPQTLATRIPGSATVSVYTGDAMSNFTYGMKKFLDEARTLARFNSHPCIVTVLDFFEANNTAYLVMEYIEGITFKEYLDQKGGKVSYEAAIEVMTPVMDALREVHTTGLLHRDVSPDNIYITANKQVKLLDFGAARYAMDEHSKTVQLKPGYAPYEQYQTKGDQGTWTDVYAVAATIYRAITGVVPLESISRMEEDDLQWPSAFGVSLTPGAENALKRGMAIKVKERFQTIRKLQDALMAERRENIEAVNGKKSAPGPQTPPPPPQEPVRVIEDVESTGTSEIKQTKNWGIYFSIAVIIGFIIFIGVRFESIKNGDMRLTPDVMGKSFNEARRLIEARDFIVKKVEIESDVERNVVFSQDPAPETKLKTGSEIRLEVSKGPKEKDSPEQVTVPSVVGKTIGEARRILNNLNLEVAQAKIAGDEPEGVVVSQNPDSGRQVELTSTVTLEVSQGPEEDKDQVTVPSMIGKKIGDARRMLKGRKLKVEESKIHSDMDEGVVVSQSPDPGEKIEADSVVSIEVSRGPKEIAIPSVVGKTYLSAVQTLSEHSLNVKRADTYSDTVPKDTIIDQDPSPDSKVTKRSATVTLKVSLGPKPKKAGFTAYQNSEQGYAVRYPEGWIPRAKGAGMAFDLPDSNGQCSVVIMSGDAQGKTLDQFAKASTVGLVRTLISGVYGSFDIVTRDHCNLGGEDGYSMNIKLSGAVNGRMLAVFTVYNGRYYMYGYMAPETIYKLNYTNAQAMFGSFRFL